MIYLYTGTPGSGKSLHCAREIYSRINRGQSVIANFDINLSVFKSKRRRRLGNFVYVDNCELSPDLLMEYAVTYHKRNTNGHITEGQTLLVIDEAQILFNSRDWQAKERMAWATFFSQHRKYGYTVILITQFDRLLDRQIRCLVEYQVIHRKISNFQFIGMLLGLLFGGNIFIAITTWYGVNEKVGSEIFVLRQKYSALYDSYKIFNPQTGGGSRGPATGCGLENDTLQNIAENNLTSTRKDKQSIQMLILFLVVKVQRFMMRIHRKSTKAPIYASEKGNTGFASLEEFWNDRK